MNPEIIQTCEDLMQLSRQMKVLMIATAERHNLTPAQLVALYWIGQNENLLMGEVAAMLNCDASNVTGIMDRLVAQGLAQRHEGSKDRRRKTTQLTDKGSNMVAILKQDLAEGLGIKDLTEAERETVHTIVMKLGGKLTNR